MQKLEKPHITDDVADRELKKKDITDEVADRELEQKLPLIKQQVQAKVDEANKATFLFVCSRPRA